MEKVSTPSSRRIGTDAEFLFLSMAGFHRIPNGNNRPDFVSLNGIFNPKLLIEVKSARHVPKRDKYHTGGVWAYKGGQRAYHEVITEAFGKEAAFYDANFYRTDGLKKTNFAVPFSNIQMTYGDVYIVPDDFAGVNFFVRNSIRTRRSVGEVEEEYREFVAGEIRDEEMLKELGDRIEHFEGNDFLALYHDDMSLTTRDLASGVGSVGGNGRISRLRDNYDIESLVSIPPIRGAFGSKILVLAKPEHEEMFDVTFREEIAKRKAKIGRINGQRRANTGLIEKVGYYRGALKYLFDGPKEIDLTDIGRKVFEKFEGERGRKELRLLRRLAYWTASKETLPQYREEARRNGDEEELNLPKHPGDDIPF